MIELPEAAVLASQINQTLTGKHIHKAIANHSPHKFAWYNGDPATYGGLLAGKTIGKATSSANHVEIEADDRLLVISTPLRFHAQGDKLPAKHQLLLEFTDGAALSATVQMWGGIQCFKVGQTGGLPDYTTSKQKPSPLSAAFDRTWFDRLFDAGTDSLSAKAFLATEQRIPGLGNGVLQDILWTARVHPRRQMRTFTSSEIDAMFAAVKTVLPEMARLGGRDTERDLYGESGGYRTILSKNTAGTPCPVCGSRIVKEAFLGGSIYYCPGCQKQ
ncbi:MAG TPA: zinc finger domain-containing protein [Armatimonadota bacterium]|jgi:formamidopyrimidine-DNA glycosylase